MQPQAQCTLCTLWHLLRSIQGIMHHTIHGTSLNYASMTWASITLQSNIKCLQTLQNRALRTITGCTRPTAISHLHHEAKILCINHHLNMRGTQFLAQCLSPSHTCHSLLTRPPNLCSKKSDPISTYQTFLRHIPQVEPTTAYIKAIHTSITKDA